MAPPSPNAQTVRGNFRDGRTKAARAMGTDRHVRCTRSASADKGLQWQRTKETAGRGSGRGAATTAIPAVVATHKKGWTSQTPAIVAPNSAGPSPPH